MDIGLKPSSPDMPGFEVIQAALRRTTEHLARELHAPSRTAPQWSDFEWKVARAVAAMHGISTLLANRLRWVGPRSWQDFLCGQRELSRLRDARLAALITSIDHSLRGACLGAVGLKGTALRALGLYLPGERPMADVDLLVAHGARAAAVATLSALGYREAFVSWRDTVLEPTRPARRSGFGEHPDHPIKIEVHDHIAEVLPISVVEITSQVLPCTPAPGLMTYPSMESLMQHLLLHCAGNMRAHALRLVQLRDVAMLAARMSHADWHSIGAWWNYPPLNLAARCFPGSIPASALASAATSCPRLLRHAAGRWSLTDVSWSNLKIHGLPGLAWARTPIEGARFAASRLRPSRERRAAIAYSSRAQPQLAQVPWYEQSHGRRLMRWFFSRPPRVQTMTTISAACEQHGAAP